MRIVVLMTVSCLLPYAKGDDGPKPTSQQLEFFESKIRPVLVRECYECHSSESKTVQGGLLLDSAAGTRQGGDSGPGVVPGDPEDSLLVSAIRYESFEMPPRKRLPEHVVKDFETWIRNGAVDPRSIQEQSVEKSSKPDIETGRQFWAFQPPQSAELGDMENYSDRIDTLVDRMLNQHGVVPNPRADKRALLRRLAFGLTGLPPDSQTLREFLSDNSPNAVEAHVTRFLNSSRYGEKWARLWLDVARYAEDQAHIVGSNKSLFFPNAYRYRDWVIDSLNKDMPYDRFLSLQIAADLLEPNAPEHIAALGFIGIGPKYYRRNDPEVMADEWEDRVDVVMRGLQGLTVACARCHDHKFDPIQTEDYYAIAGVFAGTEMFNRPLSEETAVSGNGHAKKPEESLHVIRDTDPTDLHVMIRGDVNNKGAIVPRGFVQVAFPGKRRAFQDGSGRVELAKCLTDPQNPLTARVIVNRVWDQLFGTGIVPTTSNFGELGARPTNQALLDDLTVGFVDNGWSLKWLQEQIVLSATWQRSSRLTESGRTKDPSNRLLWRMPRRRMSVEVWRDSVLAVSGRLSAEVGGPSIQPDDPMELRRTIYAEVSRFQLNPLLSLFDFPDPNVHSSGRLQTTTPLQKLFLLNSPFMQAQASGIVDSLKPEGTYQEMTARMFDRILQRAASEEELRAVGDFLRRHPEDGTIRAAQSLITSNEFWFID